MVAQLEQVGRILRLTHLAERGGGHGAHEVGQRINALEVRGEQVRRALALRARRIVKHQHAAHAAGVFRCGGVGVEREIEVKAAEAVRLRDGGRGGHVGRVAHKADAIGIKIRLQRVGEPVHIVLLAAASGDVGIGLLCGGAEIDFRHNDASLSLHFMRRRAVSCADFPTLRGDRAKIKRRRSVSLFLVFSGDQTAAFFSFLFSALWMSRITIRMARPARSVTVPGMTISRPPAISAIREYHFRSWIR